MGGRSGNQDEEHGADETDEQECDSGGKEMSEPASGETSDTPDSSASDGTLVNLFDRYESVTVFRVVGAVVVLALVLRLVDLGARTAHWDEARVAYWAYFYQETGSLAYYWEEHGPLVQLAAARLFDVFGVTDFAARLPVAVVGGFLALVAVLFREHLRRSETVALALLLSLNPVLLYYSRFMRSDVLVAAFMFTAFGLLVRYYDTRRAYYLLGAGAFVGLGFAAKENAIAYVLTWVGATGLLAVQMLLLDGKAAVDRYSPLHGEGWRPQASSETLRSTGVGIVAFVLAFLTTIGVTFLPRGQGLERRLNPDPGTEYVDFGAALTRPGQFVSLADDGLRTAYEGYLDWFDQSADASSGTYTEFFVEYLQFLLEYAPLLVLLGVAGFALEFTRRSDARKLVMFMGFCAAGSLAGYPLASHIQGDWAWLSVHIVVALTVPAAVGLAWLFRTGWREFEARFQPERLDVALAVTLVVLLGLLWFWMLPMSSVYLDHQAEDNELAQFAQPNSDLKPMVDRLDAIADDGEDVVLYYGEQGESYDRGVALVHPDISSGVGGWQIHPTCSIWGNTQPLNWYFAVADADPTCERSPDALTEPAAAGEPSMIIAVPDDSTIPVDTLDDEYEARSYYLRNVGMEIVVYTHESDL